MHKTGVIPANAGGHLWFELSPGKFGVSYYNDVATTSTALNTLTILDKCPFLDATD